MYTRTARDYAADKNLSNLVQEMRKMFFFENWKLLRQRRDQSVHLGFLFRFEDLHRVRFSSCVTDLLYFLYTTVDFDVRRDHVMDFLAVYHDHFSKVNIKWLYK